jgi:hypothetical protein
MPPKSTKHHVPNWNKDSIVTTALKIMMHHGKDSPKEATDYFVEETYKVLKIG